MSIQEADFYPDFDVAAAYEAQRPAAGPDRLRFLEGRVRELTGRVLELEKDAREAHRARVTGSPQDAAILDLLGRLQALEARLDGQQEG
jgi:hypothetical protein